MNKYVPGMGNSSAKILILGEAPSYEEEEQLRPFVGPSGRELDKLLRDSGINRGECWLTNVSKYMVPPNIGQKKIPFSIRAKQAGIDINVQLSELQTEINSIRPNVILALGGTALWALTGKSSIQAQRGSILLGMGRKMVPTYHPAHLIHQAKGEISGYWQRQVMIFDFKRAKSQSEFPEINRPSRNLQVCKNSAQLYDFIQRYKNHSRLSVDIEAHGSCMPICIGLAANKQEGLTVPLWNSIGQKEPISTIPDADLTQIWILLAKLLYEKKIIGQNFGYDRDKILRLGFPIKNLYSDTMLKAFAINPELPKNLAFNTSIYTEEPYYKDEGMYEGSINDLLTGCARDSCVTFEIDEAMDPDIDEINQRPFYENFLIPLSSLYWEIETTGFKIDYDVRDALIHKYVRLDELTRYKLWQATGQFINVSSPKQINTLLYDTLHLPVYKGTGEEIITKIINNKKTNEKNKEILELILEDRGLRKTIGTYLMARPDYDGRMKTSYFLCLKTGRTSTNLLEPPIRPIYEYKDAETGTKKKKAVGSAFQTQTKHGDIGEDIRSQYIPDTDEVFIQADSSQAEARVIFLLADDEEALKDIDEHDYHALTATWFFGGVESDYSKKVLGYESPIRFAGKTLRHAGHLGAGARRAASDLNNSARKYKIDFRISELQAEKALRTFHTRQPKIQKVFQDSVIKCIQTTRKLVAPVPYGLGVKYGGTRTFFERYNEDLFREAFSYLPQRAVSDNTKAAALRLVRQRDTKKIPNFRLIMESHDALLFSVKRTQVNELVPTIREEMERPIDFENCSISRRSLIIPCDIEIGEKNYKEMSKFKWLT